jgi:hypothetical protein
VTRRASFSACVIAVVVALAGPGCRQVTPLPADALQDIQSLEQFHAAFNGEVNRPRLLVLLSPT